MLDVRGLAPLLSVFDMPTSLQFYCDALGCEIVSADGKTPQESDWVMLRLNGMEIMLNTAYDRSRRPPQPDTQRSAAHRDVCLYFGCPDVDQAYGLLQATGLKIDPPKVAWYGMKQLYVTDPDGYLLCFQWKVERVIRQRRLEAAMRTLLQAVRLLAIVVWVGGIIFFAFVLAPVAFRVLPVHQAGLVVGGTLPVLDQVGFMCGVLFLLTSNQLGGTSARHRLPQFLVVVFMCVLTIYLHGGILPRMERDRASAGGDITLASPTDPARADFDRLHRLSERLEGAVLLGGLGLIVLLAAEREPTRPLVPKPRRDTIAS